MTLRATLLGLLLAPGAYCDNLPTYAVVIRDCGEAVALVLATAMAVKVITAEEYAEAGDDIETQIRRLGKPGREIVGRMDRELRKGCAHI